MREDLISQRDLWNAQHEERREEHKDVADVPNAFAKKCLGYIPEGGRVLDLGAASGRDSRFFVREKNCQVIALDFSVKALKHLQEDAEKDGSIDFINPIGADIKKVPLSGDGVLDAVYARSSLHISDEELERLLGQMLKMLKPDGYIMVEGKNLLDPKIQRSRTVADNLVSDSDGHIRRIWTKEYIMNYIIKKFDLHLIELNLSSGQRVDRDSRYVNFIAQKNGTGKK